MSRSLPAQGSQPSTASPFKQDVFVYSASPGSESPSAGAAATPVIMSRSPTGGSREGWGGAPALPWLLETLEAPGVPRRRVGMGSAALGWRRPLPSLAWAAGGCRRRWGEAAAALALGRTGVPRDAGQALAPPETLIPTGLFRRDAPTCFIALFPGGICFPSKLERRGGFCCGFVSSLLP